MVTRRVSHSFNKNFKALIHHVMVFLQKFRTAQYKSHLCKVGRAHSISGSNLQYVNLPTWDQISDFRKMKTELVHVQVVLYFSRERDGRRLCQTLGVLWNRSKQASLISAECVCLSLNVRTPSGQEDKVQSNADTLCIPVQLLDKTDTDLQSKSKHCNMEVNKTVHFLWKYPLLFFWWTTDN